MASTTLVTEFGPPDYHHLLEFNSFQAKLPPFALVCLINGDKINKHYNMLHRQL